MSAIDSKRRTIWIVDAHRDDGKRYVVHADEKLTAFLELQGDARVRREFDLVIAAQKRARMQRRFLEAGSAPNSGTARGDFC